MRNFEQAMFGADILALALDPVAAESPEAVAELITMAEGRRPPLEAAASLLIARLHRRSDDFAATKALSSVTGALSRIGREMPAVPTRRR